MAAGVFGLSVHPTFYKGSFPDDLFLGTFYHQHLGEEYGGLSVCEDKGRIKIQTCRGLLRPSFEGKLDSFRGANGIGYCGSAREPFRTRIRGKNVSLCFCGNVINRYQLISRFENKGHIFERGDDIEVIAILIAQEKTIVKGIERMNQEVEGAYSLLILTEEGIYTAVSPDNHWPLVIGEKGGAVAVASESGGFDNLGLGRERYLEPGEIIFMKDGNYWRRGHVYHGENIQTCSFLWVYTTFPNSEIQKIPASLVRKRLGAAHARRDIKGGFIPHIVIPVPDSGRFHAVGYQQEFCRQMMLGKIKRVPFYDELLLKYGYAGRSYTPQSQEARDREAFIKILGSGETREMLLEALEFLAEIVGTSVEEIIIVICEDSVVRGTQIRQNLAPKVKEIVQEVHVRASNPELLSHCPWGKTTKKGETLAERLPKIEDRTKELGIDSLRYNTIDDLVEAIGLPREQLCVDCSLSRKE